MMLHGLVHLMGVMLLLRLEEPGDLTYEMASPEPGTTLGVVFAGLWLMACVLFVAAGWTVIRGHASARLVATASVVSLIAIAPMAATAPAGILLSAVFLVGAVVRRR